MTETRRVLIRPEWDGDDGPKLHPGDTVAFADLAEVSFAGDDLDGVTFLGCRCNGADFSGAALAGSRFVGCFASPLGDPVDLPADAAEIIHSHMSTGSEWPLQVVSAFWRAMTAGNNERYRAVVEIGEASFPLVGPALTGLLDDPEWDVRSAVVQALTALRGDGFPDGDAEITLAVVTAVGDASSMVSSWAIDLVREVRPPREALEAAIHPVHDDDPSQVLTALRAVVGLSGAGDPYDVVATTFDGASLLGLLRSPHSAVRGEYLRALGAADQDVPEAWETGLRDEDFGVRIRALTAIRLLDEDHKPSAALVEPLLSDPDEAVRIEALFTLGQLGDFNRDAVTAALSDESERVRGYAAQLLAS